MTLKLGCPVNSIHHDFEKGVGTVHMPSGCCVDMQSTINFFKSIDSDVRQILTWADGTLDTQYVNHDGDDEWIAI